MLKLWKNVSMPSSITASNIPETIPIFEFSANEFHTKLKKRWNSRVENRRMK